MKFLFDIFPVLLFFLVLKFAERDPAQAKALIDHYFAGLLSNGQSAGEVAPVVLATIITVVATIFQISYLLIKRIKVEALLWLSFIIMMAFGSATIYFQSPLFIKWKPSILYWCYAAAFILAQVLFKTNLLKIAMGSQIKLPEPVWSRLSLVWAGFFVSMGILNIYVAYHYSTDTWANIKLISVVGIMPAFVIIQSLYLSKYMEEPQA